MVLCYPPRHSNRWIERMETSNSVGRKWNQASIISVYEIQGNTQRLGQISLIDGWLRMEQEKGEIYHLNNHGVAVDRSCLSKNVGTCTGQQDKQIWWKYSSRRRATCSQSSLAANLISSCITAWVNIVISDKNRMSDTGL